MDEDELPAESADPLLTCLMCKRLLREAVQLKCLHNYCLPCFRKAASKAAKKKGIRCSCGLKTLHGSEQPNGFIDGQVRSYRWTAESRMCAVCKGNGEHNKPALLWCRTCRHSLCGDCVAGHQQFKRQHVTQSLEDLKSLDEVCKQTTASSCAIHKKPLDIACLNCEKAKCITCWAECNEKNHEMHVVGDESFDRYVGGFISSITSIECELLRKFEGLHKHKSVLRDEKAERDRHLEKICARKRRIVEAVETTYQECKIATRRAYEELEEAATLADCIEVHLSDARKYIRRLIKSNEKCEIFNQQKIVRECLSDLSAELDSLLEGLTTTTKEVTTEASLPADVENVVQEYFGKPRKYAASSSRTHNISQQHVLKQQHFFFFDDPVEPLELTNDDCYDVALTKDGQSLLLAAYLEGLLELSSSTGEQMSRWHPPKHIQIPDSVLAVDTLNDGGAAVSLENARLVVILRRSCNGGSNDIAASEGSAWTEVFRFEQLPWSASSLSAHADVLAATEQRGPGLLLLSVSSRRRLSDTVLQRGYTIDCVAVAAGKLVTGSRRKVIVGVGGQTANVLEAHSLGRRDTFRWRHLLSSSCDRKGKENLLSICADSVGGCLYAAVTWSDERSGRVCALSLADGSELRRVVMTFIDGDCPWILSLCDDGAVADGQPRQTSESRCSSGRVIKLAVLHTKACYVTVQRSIDYFFE